MTLTLITAKKNQQYMFFKSSIIFFLYDGVNIIAQSNIAKIA